MANVVGIKYRGIDGMKKAAGQANIGPISGEEVRVAQDVDNELRREP